MRRCAYPRSGQVLAARQKEPRHGVCDAQLRSCVRGAVAEEASSASRAAQGVRVRATLARGSTTGPQEAPRVASATFGELAAQADCTRPALVTTRGCVVFGVSYVGIFARAASWSLYQRASISRKIA